MKIVSTNAKKKLEGAPIEQMKCLEEIRKPEKTKKYKIEIQTDTESNKITYMLTYFDPVKNVRRRRLLSRMRAGGGGC